ncbi:tyrosine-type recombinase/integrase, partial [Bifidobacterium longum]|uniref:tyrosine-type recombinase/integrase n=1 Tax=Bifidobacterium longum TaxID=216816 RepID=UPI001E38193D
MSKARKTAASSGEPDFWRVARDWLHHWLPKVRGSSPKTVEAYRIGLESYVRWLETTEGTQRSHIGFGHFDRARLGRWVEWMRTERGYSDRTIMLRMTTMRVFLDHAGLEHPALTALGNDAAGIRVKPPARKPVDHLGEEHTKALLTAWGTGDAKSRRNRMLLILMYDTAARIGELAALTIADVGMDKPARVTLTGKRGKSRVVPLGERTRTHLGAYLEEFHPGPSMRDGDRPLFHSTRNGAIQPLSVDRIDEILKTAAARARRGTCPSMPERVHCHLIRRTRAMDLLPTGRAATAHHATARPRKHEHNQRVLRVRDPRHDAQSRRCGQPRPRPLQGDMAQRATTPTTTHPQITRNVKPGNYMGHGQPPRPRTVPRLNNKPGLIGVDDRMLPVAER